MQVNLRNDWFGPDSTLYRRDHNPHEFSDEWKKLLPPSAKIIGDDGDEGDDEKAEIVKSQHKK